MHAQQAASRATADRQGNPRRRVKQLDDPLRDDPVAAIDNTCVGCGNCGEVADAAVLCPSFFRADVVHNPNAFDKWRAHVTQKFIHWLQARRERLGVVA